MPKPDKPSKEPDIESGKPTIDQESHDENVGQRQKSNVTTDGKPTIDQENHDQNVGQRQKSDAEGDTPRIEEDNRGLNYGQRPGSTVAEDNDVE
jgi:hypothetical protein